METPRLPTTDHDMLVTLVAHVEAIREDLRATNLAMTTKAEDHEHRIRRIEKSYISWPILVGALTELSSFVAALWYLRK